MVENLDVFGSLRSVHQSFICQQYISYFAVQGSQSANVLCHTVASSYVYVCVCVCVFACVCMRVCLYVCACVQVCVMYDTGVCA